MLTLAAFVLALGLLIAVHEYGHYRMARFCGVKVLRFSIGFGRVLARWQPKGSATEFVLGAFPLGGYVLMLDEREAPVPDDQRHLAFNTQPLRSRVAIVAAGPAANLLLAVVLYAVVNWSGVQSAAPILARPVADSIAARAGLLGGERVRAAAIADDDLQVTESFESLHWVMTRAALRRQALRLEVTAANGAGARELVLDLGGLEAKEATAKLFRDIGIVGPLSAPVIGKVSPGGAAQRAGLIEGDLVQRVGSVAIVDGLQLRDLIRASTAAAESSGQLWRLKRGDAILELTVKPELKPEGDTQVGRIGAYVGGPPELVTLRYGALDGLRLAVVRTWEVAGLTVRMMGQMIVGQASLKNLSGPLTIADYAGKSASLGLTQYLVFLALISVSLGVLNLLPLPVLDGGHLMYYLWEGITGRSVSDAWMERLQRGGVAVLILMMSIALFNDIGRLFG
ncbi:RIP metalloprotease RseP [Rhodoferax sp.]|uniref:RIP metalloprotease RseP n=1 Tax=Rhodoferax sp. TaxID=50421 RepID=UPI00275BA657|nr:RIP metalloprotease RseP [Rhodoferax sp.]